MVNGNYVCNINFCLRFASLWHSFYGMSVFYVSGDTFMIFCCDWGSLSTVFTISPTSPSQSTTMAFSSSEYNNIFLEKMNSNFWIMKPMFHFQMGIIIDRFPVQTKIPNEFPKYQENILKHLCNNPTRVSEYYNGYVLLFILLVIPLLYWLCLKELKIPSKIGPKFAIDLVGLKK